MSTNFFFQKFVDKAQQCFAFTPWKDSSDIFGIRILKIKGKKNIAHRGSRGRFLLLPKKEIELDWPPAKVFIFVIDFFNLVR